MDFVHDLGSRSDVLRKGASAHKLQLIVRWPSRLREAQATLNALQELPRYFIAHDVSLVLVALV